MNRDRQFLLDILQSADLIQTYTDGYTRAQFIADIQAQDSVIRRLLIVAEAARRLSPEMRDRLSEISWSEINGMRNRLVQDRKSTRLNSSHQISSYAVFCLKKKKSQYSI